MPLGRGLGSLIPNLKNISVAANGKDKSYDLGVENKKTVQKDGELWHIPISLIKANSYQPRQNFDHQDLEELINSIKEHGVIQPLLITEREDGCYELIAGERRFRAAQIAGLTTVPAVMRKVTGSQKLELALIENIQRRDLSPLEEAFAFARLIKEFGLTQEEVSIKIGKSRSYIGNILRLLDLPEEIQKGLVDGIISSSAARAILGLDSKKEQLKLYEKISQEKNSVHVIEKTVADKRWQEKNLTRRDPVIIDYEQKLREFLGTKVQITKKRGKGSINIEYYSDEELKRLLKEILKK